MVFLHEQFCLCFMMEVAPYGGCWTLWGIGPFLLPGMGESYQIAIRRMNLLPSALRAKSHHSRSGIHEMKFDESK